MSDAMDCGFDWANAGTFTLTYGFSTNDNGSWQQRPGAADTINALHDLYFSFFETSQTNPSEMLLHSVNVQFQLTEGNIATPVVGWGAANNMIQSKTFTPDATGAVNGWSAGLQEHGTAWSLGPFTFNPSLQQVTCTYEVSVACTAKIGPNGLEKTWNVDPELIIGGRE